MAATESAAAAAPAAPVADDGKSAEKVEKLGKVEKPDEEKYKKDLAEAEKQLSSIQDKMVLPPNPSPTRLKAVLRRLGGIKN